MLEKGSQDSAPPASGEPRESLERSLRDGCFHAVMLGTGEAYLSPFGIFLGMGALELGLLATLPLLVGSLSQLGAVQLLQRLERRKPLVTGPALAQALSWLPMVALPFCFPAEARPLVLAMAMLYHVTGSFISPAWNSWMGDLVPPSLRGRYFGRREQLRMGFQLGALCAAGLLLALFKHLGSPWAGFAVIFGIALVARLASVRELWAMREPAYEPPPPEASFTLGQFLRRSPSSNFGRFTLYVALVMAATHVSGPFFSLFMLRDLGFSYLEFTASASAVLVAQVITLRQWGRLGDRFGNRLLLKITGFAVPFVPLGWLVATSLPAIVVLQLVAGAVWAGFNLSVVNFLFDAVTPVKRARCVAYYNLLLQTGTCAGAVIGGALAPYMPKVLLLPWGELRLVSGLQMLFLLSGVLRLLLALAFVPTIREVRPVAHFGNVFVRVAGLAAARGVRLSIFNGVHPDERRDPPQPTEDSDDGL